MRHVLANAGYGVASTEKSRRSEKDHQAGECDCKVLAHDIRLWVSAACPRFTKQNARAWQWMHASSHRSSWLSAALPFIAAFSAVCYFRGHRHCDGIRIDQSPFLDSHDGHGRCRKIGRLVV